MYRVEDKYAPSYMDVAILKKRMAAILPVDASGNIDKGYKISSLYFDDIYDTHLLDTVAGNSVRKKFRIRIYNDSFDHIKLEVKYKYYNRIKKNSVSISVEQMESLINGIPIGSHYSMDDPRTEFDMAIQRYSLRPKVIVTYERMAYIYDVGNVRITFDENVRGSSRIEYFGCSNLVYDYPESRNSIMEVKYDEFLPDFIAQTLEIDSMWQMAFSKYRICREIYN